MVPDSKPPAARGTGAPLSTSGSPLPVAGPPAADVRSTRQKRALSAVLAETDRFRSAQELHAALRARGERVGLTTVYQQLRTLAAEARGEMAGPESSILKIRGTEIQQRITELAEEAAGYYAFPDERALGANEKLGPDYALGAAGRYFNMRKASIYGGSNEIQRNIIAKAILGL